MSASALGQFRLYPRDVEWNTPAGRLWRLLAGSPFFPSDGALPLEASRFRLYLEPHDARTRAGLAWTSTGGPFLLPFQQTAVSMRRAVVAALKADPAVVAIVGDRVFPGVVPDTQRLPALVYEFSRARRQHDLDGPTGVLFASVHLHAIARNLSDCETIAEAVRQVLDGRTARLPYPGGEVDVLETIAAEESDSWAQSVDGSGVGLFEIEMTYAFGYREPLPARMT